MSAFSSKYVPRVLASPVRASSQVAIGLGWVWVWFVSCVGFVHPLSLVGFVSCVVGLWPAGMSCGSDAEPMGSIHVNIYTPPHRPHTPQHNTPPTRRQRRHGEEQNPRHAQQRAQRPGPPPMPHHPLHHRPAPLLLLLLLLSIAPGPRPRSYTSRRRRPLWLPLPLLQLPPPPPPRPPQRGGSLFHLAFECGVAIYDTMAASSLLLLWLGLCVLCCGVCVWYLSEWTVAGGRLRMANSRRAAPLEIDDCNQCTSIDRSIGSTPMPAIESASHARRPACPATIQSKPKSAACACELSLPNIGLTARCRCRLLRTGWTPVWVTSAHQCPPIAIARRHQR